MASLHIEGVRPKYKVLAVCAVTVSLGACNAVLGIDAPKDTPSGPVVQERTNERWEAGSPKGDDEEDFPSTGEPPEPSPHAWAAWPMPNPSSLGDAGASQQYSVPSSGIVVDSITKLSWQRAAETKTRSREDAEEYCASLVIAGGGFRLPSRIELLSLIDFTQAGTYIDPRAFPDAPRGEFWSSSRFAKNRSSGWVINFGFSTTLALLDAEDNEHLVRCVR